MSRKKKGQKRLSAETKKHGLGKGKQKKRQGEGGKMVKQERKWGGDGAGPSNGSETRRGSWFKIVPKGQKEKTKRGGHG